jgi:hypothetical protein
VTFDNTAAEALTRKGGGNIAKFPNIGDMVKIKITGLEERQQTDFITGEPITWADGKPAAKVAPAEAFAVPKTAVKVSG